MSAASASPSPTPKRRSLDGRVGFRQREHDAAAIIGEEGVDDAAHTLDLLSRPVAKHFAKKLVFLLPAKLSPSMVGSFDLTTRSSAEATTAAETAFVIGEERLADFTAHAAFEPPSVASSAAEPTKLDQPTRWSLARPTEHEDRKKIRVGEVPTEDRANVSQA